MDFCPSAVEWGNVADWATVAIGLLAAVATFMAIWVALHTAEKAMALERSLRDEEARLAAEAARLRAVARSIVFDHEMYMLGGDLKEMIKLLSDGYIAADPRQAVHWMVTHEPAQELQMLNRFAGEFDVFGKEDASTFLLVLSGLSSVVEMKSLGELTDAPLHVVERTVKARRDAIVVYLGKLAEARAVTRRWAGELREDLPATDW